MSGKKYDVYSGNEKIGEVWGKSAEEEAADLLSAINNNIDREERRSLRQSDRIAAQFGDMDAIEREAIRARASDAVGKEIRWKRVFIIAIVVSIISTLSSMSSFGVPEDQNRIVYITGLLALRIVSIYTIIDIALIVAHGILKKKYFSKEFFELGAKSITGDVLGKVVMVAFWLCLYRQFNTFALYIFTIYAFFKWMGAKLETSNAIHEVVKMEDRALGKW